MSKEARTLWLVVVLLALALPAVTLGVGGLGYSVLFPRLDSFAHHDTIIQLSVLVRNSSPAPESLCDTFRIWDGVAHTTSPVVMEPASEKIIPLVDWVRDGYGTEPPCPSASDGFLICGDGHGSATGFDGQNYLVAWWHTIAQTRYGIRGARVTQDGTILDPGGFTICDSPGMNASYPQVAFDGANYLVVWEDFRRTGGIYDVYGARVTSAGAVLDPNGFPICTSTGISGAAPSNVFRPAVAFQGDRYFVTWVKDTLANGTYYHEIFGSEVMPNGQVVHPDGVPISPPPDPWPNDGYCVAPAIAAGLGSYFVAWQWNSETSSMWFEARGALITPTGSTIRDIQISSPEAFSPRIAFSGVGPGFEVVYQEVLGNPTRWAIFAQPYTPAGEPVGNRVCVRDGDPNNRFPASPDIAFDGLSYLEVWIDSRTGENQFDIYAKRLSWDGRVVEPESCLDSQYPNFDPNVVYGARNFLATWVHTQYNEIRGSLVDATLIPSDATSQNNGRHIARAPNQSDVDWAFSTNIGFFVRTRGDALMLPPFYVGLGERPSVAENGFQATWACADSGGTLSGFIRRSDGTWAATTICSADAIETPSLCISQVHQSPTTLDMGYVVYVRKSFSQSKDYVCLAAFDSLGVYYSTVLDEGDNTQGISVSSPCIALTPGDFLHVVWTKVGLGGVARVYYDGTEYPVKPWLVRQGFQPVWYGVTPISLPYGEPATHCFVEAEGQNIYANWRGPFSTSNQTGEIWKRIGTMQPGGPPQWQLQLHNVSQTPGQESDYPSMSTGRAVVWQEQLGSGSLQQWDVLTRVDNSLVNLSNTTTNSCYPHANVLPNAPWPPGGLSRLTAVWTEESPGASSYDVRIADYYFPSSPGPNPPPVEVTCGSALPSPYCLQRDGFDSTGLLPIDYSGIQLAYRLPYLNPQKYYLMEAVAYQTTATTGQEQFVLPGCGTWNLTVGPGIPETLRIVMPPGSHDSCATTLWINRISGLRATLAGVKLYEYEVVPSTGGAQSGKVNPLQVPKELVLEQSWPNPATRTLTIRFGIPKMTNVSLNVYDITGKLVRTLQTNDKVKPGYYNINWNCRDNRDREIAGGVYFYRLVTSEKLQTSSGEPAARVKTRKLVIAR